VLKYYCKIAPCIVISIYSVLWNNWKRGNVRLHPCNSFFFLFPLVIVIENKTLAADDSPHANPSIKQQNSYKLYLKFLFICQENVIASHYNFVTDKRGTEVKTAECVSLYTP
jgi:hypothetical protein